VAFYAEKLDLFARHCEAQGVDRVEDLTPDLLRRWVLHESQHRTPGGTHALYRSARAFVRWWGDEFEPEGWRDPFRKVPPPRVPEEALEPLPIDDLRAMLATCNGHKFLADRDRAILRALLDSGCRASEFCALNIDDIEKVRVEDHVTFAVTIRQGKGRKPREVFLGRLAYRELSRYLRHRGDALPGDPLWVGKDRHSRLRYPGLRSLVRSRAIKAEVTEPSLHSFRRAFALAMLRSGADVVSLQRMLGHADLSILRRYVAQTTADLAKVHAEHAPGDRLLG